MVFVLDTNRKPLAPCHEARARMLLNNGKAAVFRAEPFTIILNREVEDEVKPFTLKIDPGIGHTGISLVREIDVPQQDGTVKPRLDVVFLAQIDHHQKEVKKNLESRAAYRRTRRGRKTRYRKARYDNRKRPEGWLPPSIRTILQNTVTIAKRLMKLCPIDHIEYELTKFDTQLMQNPDIKGKEYQEGPLYRTNIRAFLRTAFHDTCQYCGKKGGDMEWEHLTPKSRGGSNALSNATLSCHKCNQEKDNRTPQEWANDIQAKPKQTARDKRLLDGIKSVQNQNFGPALADAGRMNSLRWALRGTLEEETGLRVSNSVSCHTKYNLSLIHI